MSAQTGVLGRHAGRVVLVTGAGQGIGRGVAQRFAAEGAAVLCLDVNAENAERTASDIVAAGGRAVGLGGDVSDARAVDAAFARAERDLGPVDVVTNIAGVYGFHAPLREITLENWRRVIDVNLTGTFLCAKRALPGMVERRFGRVINVASGHALSGRPRVAPYSASKTAVIGFTKALALEVARGGVTVNAVMPGITDTPMPRMYGDEAHLRQQGERNPMGRIGQPADIAAAMTFLASEDASYITGQTIAVNGGVRELP